jgi:flavorubredoxin
MPTRALYDDGVHRNLLLPEFGSGQAVQANQHLVVHGGAGMILDPGGHKVFPAAMSETNSVLGKGTLSIIFFSHQDPDIVAAANGWLMTTDAVAYISQLWIRFVPHFGLDQLVVERLRPIPDEGMWIDLNGAKLAFVPAHFLHSPGNHQVWDPQSRILYTGDLGASLGAPYDEVADFETHVPFMEGFHRRYIASGRAMKAWAAMARELDPEIIAPQHGAYFRGRDLTRRFIDWAGSLECGVDVMPSPYRVPA